MFVADKEDKRFLSRELLVISHPSDTVTECFALAYQFGGALRNNGNKGCAFAMLHFYVFLRNGGEFFVKRLSLSFVDLGFFAVIFVDADIVPMPEIVRQKMLFFVRSSPRN